MRRVALAFVLVAVSLAVWHPASQAAQPDPAFAPDEVLVQYREGASEAQRGAARGRVNGVTKRSLRAPQAGAGGLELVAVRGVDVRGAIARLQADPSVAFAEPNYLLAHGPITPSATTNDRGYTNGSHWGLYGEKSSPTNQYGSQAGEVWARRPANVTSSPYTGSKGVYVGVIDEGIMHTHCDLARNIWTNPYDPADGVDNDGNGRIDDVHGWDFFNGNNTVFDGNGTEGWDNHGTHVSGTIGSASNEGQCQTGQYGDGGDVGVNWDVTLIAGKFLGPEFGYLHQAVEAVEYFTDLKVRHKLNIVALNNSWGGGDYSQALHEAIIRAAKADILFIAAAGNDGRNNDATASYPSGYNTMQGTSTESAALYDSVIAVAAIASNGSLASFSNWGKATVDLGASGVDIWSTTASPGAWASYSGTSMATPHVAGAVALYKAVYPGATAAQVRTAVLDAARVRQTTSLKGKTATNGRLDLSCMWNPAKTQRLTSTCAR